MLKRWICVDDFYEKDGDVKPYLFDALYVATMNIELSVYCKDVGAAKHELQHHDMQYRECALRLADDLKGSLKWNDARRRGFYGRVNKRTPIVERLHWSSKPDLQVVKRLTIEGLMYLIPLFLTEDDDEKP